MSFYGPENRMFIEADLQKGFIADSQIQRCNLDTLNVNGARWEKTDLQEVNANESRFSDMRFSQSVFSRSSFWASLFTNIDFDAVTLTGLTLIKSRWKNILFNAGNMAHNTLVRAHLAEVRYINSSISDFESAYAVFSNCFFVNCAFEITYAGGMNGFSGATLQNCIFYNCRFSGFPLRGARLENCLFFRCFGEMGELEGTYMINPKIDETRRSLAGMTEKQLADALALALTEARDASSVAGGATPQLANFAQAVQYLKKNFDFAELDAFSTEADLVYVSAADRRILLTDRDSIQTNTRHEFNAETQTPKTDSGKTEESHNDPFDNAAGRFSHLEF